VADVAQTFMLKPGNGLARVLCFSANPGLLLEYIPCSKFPTWRANTAMKRRGDLLIYSRAIEVPRSPAPVSGFALCSGCVFRQLAFGLGL
jgi:hypothetical protein